MGGQQQGISFKYLHLILHCLSSSNCSGFNNSSPSKRSLLIQTAQANPYNSNQRWSSILKEIPFSVLANSKQVAEFDLVESSINENRAIFPLSNIMRVSKGYSLSGFTRSFSVPSSNPAL